MKYRRKSINCKIRRYLNFSALKSLKNIGTARIIYDPVYYTITISFTNYTVINNNCNNSSISR